LCPEFLAMPFNEKQVQIIETAEKLFSTNGYSGTSVRDISEAAGVNLAMISYYFGSKEKLLEALFQHRSEHVRMRVETLLNDDTKDPLQKMELLIDEYLERLLAKERFYKIMVCEQSMEKNQPILDMLSEMKQRNTTAISELVRDGQNKGVFVKNIDVVLMMNTMVGTITQMLVSKHHYRTFHKQLDMPDAMFEQQFRKKLSAHIKFLFKAILTHEA
jgi:AcrR family transcriptional regulator